MGASGSNDRRRRPRGGKGGEDPNGSEGRRRQPMRPPPPERPRASKAPAAPSGTGPRPGEPAPDFCLEAVSGGGEVELSALRGHKPVVIFFFPRPGAPADNQIALDFQRAYPELHTKGVAVLGVCNDPPPKLERFAHDLGLSYPILNDPGGRVATLFGAYAFKSVQGRSYRGIIRSTFLIDRGGLVVRAWNRVHVRGHVDQVMAAVAALSRDRRRDGQD